MKQLVLPSVALLSLACAGSGPREAAQPPDAASDTGDPCAPSRTIALDPKTSTEADVQRAFAAAKPGDVISLGEGTFRFQNTLTLSASCVTVRGAGSDKTILDFAGQVAGSDGVYGDRNKRLTIENLAVRDTRGNAIKVLGGEDVVFRKVRTEWTGAEPSAHGAYGLYPVQSKRVLIEDCVATGASDSGIYVGQSDQVVVRRNRAEQNVAGIEVENTFHADVYDNVAIHNTAGILVFDLPGLPQIGGHSVRVFRNTIKENNTANFAPKGNTVGLVPAGVGFLVMANHDVELFENVFVDNKTVHAAVVSYLVAQLPINDPKYDPYPARIHIRDNSYVGGGTEPDTDRELGLLLAANRTKFPGAVISRVLYDGLASPAAPAAENAMQICIKPGEGVTFANLHLDALKGVELQPTFDVEKHACTLPSLPAISWSGLAP